MAFRSSYSAALAAAQLDVIPKRTRGTYTAVACVLCRAKKVKCDGESPCANCKRKGVECVSSQPQRTALTQSSAQFSTAASTIASAVFFLESKKAADAAAAAAAAGGGGGGGGYGMANNGVDSFAPPLYHYQDSCHNDNGAMAAANGEMACSSRNGFTETVMEQEEKEQEFGGVITPSYSNVPAVQQPHQQQQQQPPAVSAPSPSSAGAILQGTPLATPTAEDIMTAASAAAAAVSAALARSSARSRMQGSILSTFLQQQQQQKQQQQNNPAPSPHMQQQNQLQQQQQNRRMKKRASNDSAESSSNGNNSKSRARAVMGASTPFSLSMPDPISYLTVVVLKECLASFNTICNPVFPLISASELLSDRYMQSSRKKDPDAYAVWNGVVALGCFLSDGNKTLVDPIAATARDCLKDVFDSPSVDQSRALLLLGIYELFSKRYLKARTYARMATVGSDTNPWFFNSVASLIRHFAMFGALEEGINLTEDAAMPFTFVPSEEALKYTTPDAPPLNWARSLELLAPINRYFLFTPAILHAVTGNFDLLAKEEIFQMLQDLDLAESLQKESNVGGPMACFFLSALNGTRAGIYFILGMKEQCAYWAVKSADWSVDENDRLFRFPLYHKNVSSCAEYLAAAGTEEMYQIIANKFKEKLARFLPMMSSVHTLGTSATNNNNNDKSNNHNQQDELPAATLAAENLGLNCSPANSTCLSASPSEDSLSLDENLRCNSSDNNIQGNNYCHILNNPSPDNNNNDGESSCCETGASVASGNSATRQTICTSAASTVSTAIAWPSVPIDDSSNRNNGDRFSSILLHHQKKDATPPATPPPPTLQSSLFSPPPPPFPSSFSSNNIVFSANAPPPPTTTTPASAAPPPDMLRYPSLGLSSEIGESVGGIGGARGGGGGGMFSSPGLTNFDHYLQGDDELLQLTDDFGKNHGNGNGITTTTTVSTDHYYSRRYGLLGAEEEDRDPFYLRSPQDAFHF